MDNAYYERLETCEPLLEEAMRLIDCGEEQQGTALLRTLADQGFAPALLALALNAQHSTGKADCHAWVEKLERLAVEPDPIAKMCAHLACDFFPTDEPPEVRKAKGRRYLEEAAALGHINAQEVLDTIRKQEGLAQRETSPYALECWEPDPLKPAILVHAYFDGACYTFARQTGAAKSSSYLGGKHGCQIAGISHGTAPLQQLVRLSQQDLGWNVPGDPLPELHLVHGFNYDGCYIEYTIETGQMLTVQKMHPTTSDAAWPYPDYPTAFPDAPLMLVERQPMPYENFCQPWRGTPHTPPDILVMVPPPRALGIALWDTEGDKADVVVVFECYLNERKIRTYATCD